MERYPRLGASRESLLFPFKRACMGKKNGPEMIDHLLSLGFPCPSTGESSFNPIGLALSHGNWDTATHLLKGLDIDPATGQRWADNDLYIDALARALDRGAQRASYEAHEGHPSSPDSIRRFFFQGVGMLKLACSDLLSHPGLPPKAQRALNAIPGSGGMPLLCLASPSEAATEALLDLGVDPNAIWHEGSGQTALHKAAINLSAGCVKLLLAKGADPEACDGENITPSELAWRYRPTTDAPRLDTLHLTRELSPAHAIMSQLFNAGASASRIGADGKNWLTRTALALDIDGLKLSLKRGDASLHPSVPPALSGLLDDPRARVGAAQAILLIHDNLRYALDPGLARRAAHALGLSPDPAPYSAPAPQPSPDGSLGIKRRIGARRELDAAHSATANTPPERSKRSAPDPLHSRSAGPLFQARSASRRL